MKKKRLAIALVLGLVVAVLAKQQLDIHQEELDQTMFLMTFLVECRKEVCNEGSLDLGAALHAKDVRPISELRLREWGFTARQEGNNVIVEFSKPHPRKVVHSLKLVSAD